MAKGFGVAGFFFTLYECNLQKWRGEHDFLNVIGSGCLAGATMSFAGGPTASAVGCLGFGAFSAIMDVVQEKFMS